MESWAGGQVISDSCTERWLRFADHGQEIGHHSLWPECCLEVITGRTHKGAGKGSLKTPLAAVKMENHPPCPWKSITGTTGTHKHQHTYTHIQSRHAEILLFLHSPSGDATCIQREVKPRVTAVVLHLCPYPSFNINLSVTTQPMPFLRSPLFCISVGRHRSSQKRTSGTEQVIF